MDNEERRQYNKEYYAKNKKRFLQNCSQKKNVNYVDEWCLIRTYLNIVLVHTVCQEEQMTQ